MHGLVLTPKWLSDSTVAYSMDYRFKSLSLTLTLVISSYFVTFFRDTSETAEPVIINYHFKSLNLEHFFNFLFEFCFDGQYDKPIYIVNNSENLCNDTRPTCSK